LFAQSVQALAQAALHLAEVEAVLAVDRLVRAEAAELLIGAGGVRRDSLDLLLLAKPKPILEGGPCLVERGEPDQRVAGTDIEINVR
jgi:hypothetical protein